jgi:hypothetical protein
MKHVGMALWVLMSISLACAVTFGLVEVGMSRAAIWHGLFTLVALLGIGWGVFTAAFGRGGLL